MTDEENAKKNKASALGEDSGSEPTGFQKADQAITQSGRNLSEVEVKVSSKVMTCL